MPKSGDCLVTINNFKIRLSAEKMNIVQIIFSSKFINCHIQFQKTVEEKNLAQSMNIPFFVLY